MNLIIDIGNTVAKVALFDRTSMVEVVYDSNQSLDSLEAVCNKYDVRKAIVATVIDLNECVLAQLNKLPVPVLWLDSHTSLPVINLYETPKLSVMTGWLPWWRPMISSRVKTFW